MQKIWVVGCDGGELVDPSCIDADKFMKKHSWL